MINGLPRKYLPPYLIGAEAITPRRFLVITQSDLQNLLLDTWAVPNNYRGVRFEGLSRLPTCHLLARKAVACRNGKVSEGDPIDARSLVAQGRCHIDSNGPIGRRPGGDDADQHEQDRNQAKDEGIRGLDPIEEAT